MRIITGTYRRRTIKAPKGDLTRPTTDRTRESLFSLVEHRHALDGAKVLDLFAGSGALGLEAISRGAERVHFVESNPVVLDVARANAAALDDDLPCTFERADVRTFLERRPSTCYDVIFADPPYEWDGMKDIADRIPPFLCPGGLFVLEHDKRIFFDDHPSLDVSRAYGRTIVSIFRYPT